MPKIKSEEALADKPPVYARRVYSDFDLSEFHTHITRESLTREQWLEKEGAAKYQEIESPVRGVGKIKRETIKIDVIEWQGRYIKKCKPSLYSELCNKWSQYQEWLRRRNFANKEQLKAYEQIHGSGNTTHE